MLPILIVYPTSHRRNGHHARPIHYPPPPQVVRNIPRNPHRLRHSRGLRSFQVHPTPYTLFITILMHDRHTSFDGTKWNGYLWPMVAIWGFDRTVWLVRIAYCNLNVRTGKYFASTTSSTVKYCKDSDLAKIEMYPAQTTLVPRPGQFYYIYQPMSLKGWENHPFTLGAYNADCRMKNEGSQQRSKLIFYIRPYDGWTRRLRDQCCKTDEKSILLCFLRVRMDMQLQFIRSTLS